MTFHEWSGRFAQFGGLAVAVASFSLYAGARTEITGLSELSRAFISAGGTDRDLLGVALVGTFIFMVGTIVFWLMRKV